MLLSGWALLGAAAASGESLYQIGNSFTWDSQPSGIASMASSLGVDLDVGHHIRCGSTLDGIVQNPTSTCVNPTSYGEFSDALPEHDWDDVVFQIYRGADSTLATDVAAAETLIQLAQSNPANAETSMYAYQSWAFKAGSEAWSNWEAAVSSDPNQPTVHRRDYFSLVLDELSTLGYDVSLVPVGDVLYRVMEEIEAGALPGLTGIDDLYRDDIHMSYGVGRFLAGTTVLSTVLGQDLTGVEIASSYGSVDPELQVALQAIVWDVVRHHPDAGLTDLLLLGDYDRDGVLGVGDYQVWQESLGSTTRLAADGNRDGIVNLADYTIWRDQMPGSGASVTLTPEPSAAMLAAILLISGAALRREPASHRSL